MSQNPRLPASTNQNPNLPVVVNDFANILLASSGLTGIVVSALGTAVRTIAVNGVKEITLTLTDSWAEISISVDEARGKVEQRVFARKKTCRVERFRILAREFDAAIKAAPSTGYEPFVEQMLLDHLKQAFTQEMTKVLQDV